MTAIKDTQVSTPTGLDSVLGYGIMIQNNTVQLEYKSLLLAVSFDIETTPH